MPAPAAAEQPAVEQPHESTPTVEGHIDGTLTSGVTLAADDQEDGDVLAEQLAEVTPVDADKGVQPSALDKKTKSKQTPTKQTAATSIKKATAKAPAKAKP